MSASARSVRSAARIRWSTRGGRFTTWNGTKGTFNGAWTVNPVEANVTGGSVNVAGPSYLWTNDKFPGDAFGVWIYGGTPAT